MTRARKRTDPATGDLVDEPVRWAGLLARQPEAFWVARGKRMAASLYRRMKTRVPAYKNFIRTAGTARRRKGAPDISKDTYLRKYPLNELSWDGVFAGGRTTIAATSGSTGVPFYFPRSLMQDRYYAAVAEMYLRSNFQIHERSTLYIVGWGMGVWIGGVFSYEAVRIVAERGRYPLSVITPGTSPDEILSAVKRLGPYFEQVIIGGYPPMIKDVIDEGVRRKMRWRDYHIKCIFSAEGFSEAFRDYILERGGMAHPYLDTLNHYGTVDLGTMAHETPISILVRRLARGNPDLNEALFGVRHRQPTLAQYIPELFYFEEADGRLLCTADSGLPLVRYDLLDSGGVKTLAAVTEVFRRHGVDLMREARKAGISHTLWNLPFVYVFERRDFTVKLSGANIYPQEIRRALEERSVAGAVTGKCAMEIVYTEEMDQRLEIYVELKRGKRTDARLAERICTSVMETLRRENSEYAYLYNNLSIERMTPRVRLVPFQTPPYFGSSGKHKWVRKGA